MSRRRIRDGLLAAVGLCAAALVFLAWLSPGAVRSVLGASIGAWCS